MKDFMPFYEGRKKNTKGTNNFFILMIWEFTFFNDMGSTVDISLFLHLFLLYFFFSFLFIILLPANNEFTGKENTWRRENCELVKELIVFTTKY